MRRSAAPSAKNAAQKNALFKNSHSEVSSTCDWGKIGETSRSYDGMLSSWDSRAGKEINDISASNEISFENNIIFNIVWRDITHKKHKTWKGDGILELSRDGTKAVLKDDTGKYLGSGRNFKLADLAEGDQIIISGKEIELQERITDQRKIFEKRKLLIANRWGEEEYQPEEPSEKKLKGHFVFRPNLVLPTIPKPKNCIRKVVKQTPEYVEPFFLTNVDYKIQVSPSLVQHLRPHQREGVQFLCNCLLGSQIPAQHGAILADEMGLGKTLQCLTIAYTLLRNRSNSGLDRVFQRVLIVTPTSIVATWNNEINKWLSFDRLYAFVVDGKHNLQKYSQQQHIPFVVVSYETFLANIDDFQQLHFDLLICDEGHRLKNSGTKIYAALRDLGIIQRILLTGTPVQNDLQEFFTLADFVNPGVFGIYSEFRKHFELPIVQSQSLDASKEIQKLANKRKEELQELSSKFLLRRTQDINRKYLPKKHEYIIFIKPSELQQFMLKKTLEFYKKRKETILQDITALQIITIMQKICNHPSLIARTKTPNLLTRNLERFLPDWSEMGPFDSAKLEFVQKLLTSTAVEENEKIVIVSNHTRTLNMLQGLCDYLNLKCVRLDGTTPVIERNGIVEKFNSKAQNGSIDELVFLLSAKAGGLGLNLCGARRLILYDNDWNPATDAQAKSRIWRDGQQNDVQIYWLVTAGTIEERIFQRQVAKVSLGSCCLQQIGNDIENVKFNAEELLDLFTLQFDFTYCQTHVSMQCNCGGNGKNLNQQLPVSTKQINELMQWRHHGPPFDPVFLRSALLENAKDNILYIFFTSN